MALLEPSIPYCRNSGLAVLFETQVARSPRAVALVFGTSTLTYEQLNADANRLARLLIREGVRPGDRVAFCLERSPLLVLGILAILKAGAVYVPLDPAYPRDRLNFMLEDSQAVLLLTTRAMAALLPGKTVCQLYLDEVADTLMRQDASNLSPLADGGSVAYIMYTSGSTGTPKGVVIPQRGVARLVLGTDYFPFGSDHAFLLLSPVSFDLSTFELWGSLLHGARCVIFPDRIPELPRLAAVLQQHRISALWLTSGLFNVVIDESPRMLATVSHVLVVGEALSLAHIQRALRQLPDTRFYNGYGPTECTTFACVHPIPRSLPPEAASVPIGRPIAHTRIEILDEQRRRVPVGEAGELYLGGDGLAAGYWNRDELTASVFVADPFSSDPRSRLYRTGDLVRQLADGALDYLGRIDGQVKIRGHRIEPGEIEFQLSRHPAVRQVTVVPRQSRLTKQLVAFLVLAPESGQAPVAWRSFLAERLPSYMIPDLFVVASELPLNPNGKVDRKRLAALDLGEKTEEADPGRPLTAAEIIIRLIWEQLLAVKNIRPEDNFFELGGDSLLAAAMMARLSARSGLDLPLALLFRSPTLEGLAAAVARDSGLTDTTVVQLQSGQGPHALFFFHGDFTGGGFYCRRLAGLIGPEPAFFAVQPNGLQGQPAPSTTDIMAERYVSLMLAQRPDGPYILAGHCNGGLMAYEVARRLTALGKRVTQVFVLDPPMIDYADTAACAESDVLSLIRRRTGDQPLERLGPEARDRVMTEVYTWLCQCHGLREYPGRVTVLLARRMYSDEDVQSLLGQFRRVAPLSEIGLIPGSHLGMLLEGAPALAAVIRHFLQRDGVLTA